MRSPALAGAVLVSSALAAVAVGGSAQAASTAAAIAYLNAQRAANGLPAGLTEDPTLTADCVAHDQYMAENRTLTHTEQADSPGYSAGGAYAGQNAVLTAGVGWDNGDPYDNAPLHLDQLLAPRLLTLGSADAYGYSCTTTFPGWTRPDPAATTVYSYPGPGATIAPAEVAKELPYTPGQLTGIPAGTTTGPYLIVLVDAPGQSPLDDPASLTGVSLTGPSGPVAVRIVDGTTPLPGGGTLAAYIAPGGFIVPATPLQPKAGYHAHVVVGFGGVQTAYDWSFITTGDDPQSELVASGGRLSFHSRSRAPVTVTFTRANGAHAASVKLSPGHGAALRLAPGSWQACGSQPARGAFAAFQRCLTLVLTGTPTLRLGPGRPQGQQLQFPVHYSSVLRGHSATLSLTPLTQHCTGYRCRTTKGATATSTIALRGGTLSVPNPPHGHGVSVRLTTAAFQLADAPWTAAHATATYISK